MWWGAGHLGLKATQTVKTVDKRQVLWFEGWWIWKCKEILFLICLVCPIFKLDRTLIWTQVTSTPYSFATIRDCRLHINLDIHADTFDFQGLQKRKLNIIRSTLGYCERKLLCIILGPYSVFLVTTDDNNIKWIGINLKSYTNLKKVAIFQ